MTKETKMQKTTAGKDKTEKKERNLKYRTAAAAALFIASAGLMIAAAVNTDFAQWYALHIYPVLAGTLSRISGMLPFSAAEVGLYILLTAFVCTTALMIKKVCKRENRGRVVFAWFSGVMLTVSILAFLYTVCCGINYHRRSFSEEEGIVTFSYSAGELEDVCRWLTSEVNDRADLVTRDENGVMRLDAPEGPGAVSAMEALGEEFEVLKGYYPEPKKLFFSEILSYQGLSGIYSPFTVEANYNGDMTAYYIPFTACHELSHLRGFMQEEEANFIAFLACVGSEREDFQYSGYLSAWVYCMNVLYRADHERWEEVRALLNPAVETDLAANNAFWNRYEGKISEAADRINDTYLKVNGQADGVLSYDRMVDLIVSGFLDARI